MREPLRNTLGSFAFPLTPCFRVYVAVIYPFFSQPTALALWLPPCSTESSEVVCHVPLLCGPFSLAVAVTCNDDTLPARSSLREEGLTQLAASLCPVPWWHSCRQHVYQEPPILQTTKADWNFKQGQAEASGLRPETPVCLLGLWSQNSISSWNQVLGHMSLRGIHPIPSLH